MCHLLSSAPSSVAVLLVPSPFTWRLDQGIFFVIGQQETMPVLDVLCQIHSEILDAVICEFQVGTVLQIIMMSSVSLMFFPSSNWGRNIISHMIVTIAVVYSRSKQRRALSNSSPRCVAFTPSISARIPRPPFSLSMTLT
jgi:hypothetical protein